MEKIEKSNIEAAKKKRRDAEEWTSEYITIAAIEEEQWNKVFKNMNEDTPIYTKREIHNNHEKKSKAIAVFEGITNQRIGYLPYNKSFDRRMYYNDVVTSYMDDGNKIYAGIVKINKKENCYVAPLKYKTLYQVAIVLSLEEKSLTEKVQYQRNIWENDRLEEIREDEEFRAKQASYVEEKSKEDIFYDDIFNSRSDHDDYDEDGIPYEDYEKDNLLPDNLYSVEVDKKIDAVDKDISLYETLDSRSDHDNYDEDGVPYEDYESRDN